jgi:hypothetical protein
MNKANSGVAADDGFSLSANFTTALYLWSPYIPNFVAYLTANHRSPATKVILMRSDKTVIVNYSYRINEIHM